MSTKKLYAGCGTCAHASGNENNVNHYCKLWQCNFNKTRTCEYYLRFDEDLNPFNPIRKPIERELDLMHFRRYCHWDALPLHEQLEALDLQKKMTHELNTGYTDIILRKQL